MTTVLIDGGRSYDIDPAGRTADAVAAEVAAALLDVAEGAQFSLKVNGQVCKPDEKPTINDGDVVELVEVTDYTWPDGTVDLAETGSIVSGADRSYPVDGTAPEVLAWVGNDPDRAQEAFDAEDARATPRTTLVASLEQIIDSGGD